MRQVNARAGGAGTGIQQWAIERERLADPGHATIERCTSRAGAMRQPICTVAAKVCRLMQHETRLAFSRRAADRGGRAEGSPSRRPECPRRDVAQSSIHRTLGLNALMSTAINGDRTNFESVVLKGKEAREVREYS